MPPEREFGDGHKILCHLPEDVLRAMDPVIAFGAKDDVSSAAGSPMRKHAPAPVASTTVTEG
jgi:hypothetical protein